jgi:diguanylate cyclase (GGDEF)-like protein
MAVKDPLTGVYNRQYLEDYLLKLIKKAKRNKNEKIMVIFFDLDNFKPINDNFGHNTGDKVLKEVADIIKSHFREYDLISRFGGDEFVAVIENPPASIYDRINRLKEIIEDTFRNYNISISLGVSNYPDDVDEKLLDEEKVIKLLDIADNRMYENKKENKRNR